MRASISRSARFCPFLPGLLNREEQAKRPGEEKVCGRGLLFEDSNGEGQEETRT